MTRTLDNITDELDQMPINIVFPALVRRAPMSRADRALRIERLIAGAAAEIERAEQAGGNPADDYGTELLAAWLKARAQAPARGTGSADTEIDPEARKAANAALAGEIATPGSRRAGARKAQAVPAAAGLPEVLAPLVAERRWIIWRYETDEVGKITKVPYQAAKPKWKASSTSPKTWTDYATAVAAAAKHDDVDGIGFQLFGSDFGAFDVDDCRDPETGALHPWVEEFLKRANSYTEITVSQKGLRVIGRIDKTAKKISRKQPIGDGASLETYRNIGRYIAMTGAALPDSPMELNALDAVMVDTVAELDKRAPSKDADTGAAAPPASKDKPKIELDWAEVDKHAGWLKNAAELPSDFSAKGKIIVAHEGALADLVAELEEAGLVEKPYGSWSDVSLALAAVFKADGRYSLEQIAAALLCDLDCNHHITKIKKDHLRRRAVERCLNRSHGPEERIAESEGSVAELNEHYALVQIGDKLAVLDTDKIRFMTVSAFELWFCNKYVTIQRGDIITNVPLGRFWTHHRDRRQYSGIEFMPHRELPGYFNLWRGWAVEPKKGDCSKFLAHLRDNVCSGNAYHYNWVVAWFAQIFQQPHIKLGTSLVLRGKMGVGKTKIGEIIGSLIGPHFVAVAEPRYITGRFNSHLLSCLLLHADEGFWAGDRAAEGKLKDLVTGLSQNIEFKGKEPIRINSYVRLLVTGNPDWMVPAGFEERRFATLDVADDHMEDYAYFAAIDEEMKNGGREALLHYLLNFDLSTVNLRQIPKTKALLEQKFASLNPEQAWWLDTLMDGRLPFSSVAEKDNTDARYCCPVSALFDAYIEHAQKHGVRRRSIEVQLGIFLKKYLPGLVRREVKHENRLGAKIITNRFYVYDFPPLAKCRASFAEALQQEIDWGSKKGMWRMTETEY